MTEREGDRVIFIEQQAVFRLFVIIIVEYRGLALCAPRLAVDDDGTAADVVADLARHASGVKFMVGGIQVLSSQQRQGAVRAFVNPPSWRRLRVGMSAGMCSSLQMTQNQIAEAPVVMISQPIALTASRQQSCSADRSKSRRIAVGKHRPRSSQK